MDIRLAKGKVTAWKVFTGTLCGILATLCMFTVNAQSAEEPTDTAIVLDASGSMWGQIDGVAKMEIARNVLNDMLATWPANHRLALTAYGHRREGDCTDIESVIGLGQVDPAAFKSALARIKPNGKTPLTAAVQQAAEGLAYTERPATVILVSDGLENCNLDPCRIAEQLEAKGVNFTAHVIGFDITQQDTSGLRCLAEKTGGRYATAETASDLSGALNEVVEETRTEPIRLLAVLSPGGEPLTQGVSWQVTELEPNFEGKYQVLFTTGAPQGRVTLENGTHRIVARRGSTRVPHIAQVDDSTRQIEVVLGAGDLLMQATLGEGTPTLTRGVSWHITEPEPNFEGKYQKVANSGAPQAKFTLPAGEYRVEARRGAARVQKMITVSGGEQKIEVISLDASDIKATATLGPGGPDIKRTINWRVELPEPDFDGKYKLVTSTGAAEPTLTLPRGTYRLITRRGQSSTVTPLEVPAGEQQRITVPIEGGEIIATAHLAEGMPPLKRVNWTVTAAEANFDGNYPKVTSTGADEPRLTLSTGSYRLTPKRGYAGATKVINVTTGSQTRHAVSLDAGELQGRVFDPNGNQLKGGVSWSVFAIDPNTGEEKRTGATGAPAPLLTLSAGTYRLQVRSRAFGTTNHTITVTPGMQQTVDITQGQPATQN